MYYFLGITIIVIKILIREVDSVKKLCWNFKHLVAINNQVLNHLHLDWKKLHTFIKPTDLGILALTEKPRDIEDKVGGQRSRVKAGDQRQKRIRFKVGNRRS